MSSGFVAASADQRVNGNDQDWSAAEQAIETNRKSQFDAGKQEGGKSLYEVLQQNRTAKQEAFEESIRLKNQFRTLDEDEIDFLDNVLESTRAKEQQLKQETANGLKSFREKREAAERAIVDATIAVNSTPEVESSAANESWTLSTRKRRRTGGTKDSTIKLRKTSSTTATTAKEQSEKPLRESTHPMRDLKRQCQLQEIRESTRNTSMTTKSDDTKAAAPILPKSTSALNLGVYSSTEEDSD